MTISDLILKRRRRRAAPASSASGHIAAGRVDHVISHDQEIQARLRIDGSTSAADADISRDLTWAGIANASADDFFDALRRILTDRLDVEAVWIVELHDDREKVFTRRIVGSDQPSVLPRQHVVGLSKRCCDQRQTMRLPGHDSSFEIIALPIPFMASAVALVCNVKSHDADELQQLAPWLATVVSWWHRLHNRRHRDEAIAESVLKLCQQFCCADDLPRAYIDLAEGLVQRLGCQHAAIAQVRGERCQLVAMSGVSQVDRRLALARAIESLLEQTVRCGHSLNWPAEPESDEGQFDLIRQTTKCDAALGFPVRDSDGNAVAAILLTGTDQRVGAPVAEELLQELAPLLCHQLQALHSPGWSRVTALLRRWTKNRKHKLASWAAIALMAMAILIFPINYRVKCPALLQPAVRRFVAAPYDGTLARSLVKPGDIASAGQVIATLDRHEIELELSAAEAELHRETKKCDVARADGDAAAAQIAKLEGDRIVQRIELLKHRSNHLEIRSPVKGIVVRGELDRAEGAPLKVGQTLFEIGSLDQMIVEVEIPEYQVPYVQEEMQVIVQLDAYPRESWTGKLASIHPSAEIREHESVFVGEVQLSNEHARLRPGMRGRATVVGDRRALAWVWLHRPYEFLVGRLAW